MPETNDLVLLRIEIDEQGADKKLEGLIAIKVRLKKELADLKKEQKAGVITAKEYQQSYTAITTQLKAADAQIKATKKSIEEQAAVTAKAEASLRQMQQGFKITNADLLAHQSANQAVKKRITELNAEMTVENARLKATATSMDKLDDMIGELEDAYRGLSQAQREDAEVGGKLLTTLAGLERQQRKHQQSIDDSKKTMKDYIRDVDVLGFNVGATIDSFKNGAQGVKLFTQGIGTARGALTLLAAVPIIAILTGLYVILTKSQKGMDFLAKATAGVSAIFSALSTKVIAIGEALANAWENPKQAVIELGNFIQTNLINRVKGFGVLIDAIRSGNLGKIADGFAQIGFGVTNAATGLKKVYDQGAAVAQMIIDIEKAEISLNTQRGKSEKFIERQKQIAEDTTKSIEARKIAERSAFAESQKIQNAEEALQKKRVALAQAEAKQNRGNRDYLKKVSEEQEKLDQIGKNRIGERTELQNQLNALDAEGAAKALDNRKKIAAEEVAEAEAALILAQRKGEETLSIEQEILQRQIKLIQARADAEKVAVEKGRGAAAQRKLIQIKADTEILEATKQSVQKSADIIYNAKSAEINSTLALTRKGTKAELDLRLEGIDAARVKEQSAIQQRIDLNNELFKKKRITEQQYNEAATKLEIEFGNVANQAAKAQSDARMEFAKSEANRLADLADKRIQTELDNSNQSLAAERDAAQKRIDLEAKTQQELLDIERKYDQISQDDYDTRSKALAAKKIAAQRALNKQIVDEDRAAQIAIIDAQLEIVRDGSKKQLDLQLKRLKKEYEQAIANAKGQDDAIEKAKTDYDNKRAKVQDDYNKKLVDQIVQIANQATAAFDSLIEASAARQTAALDDQYKAILSSAALSAEGRAQIEEKYAKEKERIDKEAGERKKKTATAENIINGIVAGIKAFADLGPIGGAIASAFIAASVIANQIKIDSQKFEEGGVNRAKGGPVFGPSHKQGGIPMYHKSGRYVGEMEGDEIILTKGVYRDPATRAIASALNVSKGGRSFSGFAPQLRYDLGGYVPSYQHAIGVTASIDANAIANAVISGVKAANIRVGVDAITQMQNDVKRVEAEADFGTGPRPRFR
jgi:hypothetical protein